MVNNNIYQIKFSSWTRNSKIIPLLMQKINKNKTNKNKTNKNKTKKTKQINIFNRAYNRDAVYVKNKTRKRKLKNYKV